MGSQSLTAAAVLPSCSLRFDDGGGAGRGGGEQENAGPCFQMPFFDGMA